MNRSLAPLALLVCAAFIAACTSNDRRSSEVEGDSGSAHKEQALYVNDETIALETRITEGVPAQSGEVGFSIAVGNGWLAVGAPAWELEPGSVAADDDTGVVGIYRRAGSGWVFQQKLEPEVRHIGERFGASVAITGDALVVGAPGHPLGGDPGRAVVFRRFGASFTQEAVLTSSASGDARFGSGLAFDGNTIVVASPLHASVFVRSDETWKEEQVLTPFGLGSAVAVDGDRIVLGAPENDDKGTNMGAVFVYVRQGDSWQSPNVIYPDEVSNFSRFGAAVALDGASLIVGAPDERSQSFNPEGAAYFYEWDGADWQRTFHAKGLPGSEFGGGISIEHDWAVVGSPGDWDWSTITFFRRMAGGWAKQSEQQAASFGSTNPDPPGFGAALALSEGTLVSGEYGDNRVIAYRVVDGIWGVTSRLTLPEATRTGFGSAILLDDAAAYVGAPGSLDVPGCVVEVLRGDGWVTWNTFSSPAPAPDDAFGTTLARRGNEILVGAPGADGGAGRVFSFYNSNPFWVESPFTINHPVLQNGVGFGSALAADGDYLVVGSPWEDGGRGAVYVLQLMGSWDVKYRVPPPVDFPELGFGYRVAIEGSRVVVSHPDTFDWNKIYTFLIPSEGDDSEPTLTEIEAPQWQSNFGASLALQGGWLFSSTPSEPDPFDPGKVTVFDGSSGTFVETAKVWPTQGSPSGRFGSALAFDGSHLLVGAQGSEGVGTAHWFDWNGAELTEIQEVGPPLVGEATTFGASVALAGSRFAIGAPPEAGPMWSGSGNGSVYFYHAGPFENGTPCTGSSQCSSGFCVEGVCCDEACDGACQACVAHRKTGGVDGACGAVAEGLSCGGDATGCLSDSSAARPATCDASGTCTPHVAPCPAGLACLGSGVCAVTCIDDNQPNDAFCAASSWCNIDGTCSEDRPGAGVCVRNAQCASNECEAGECKSDLGEQCEADAECASGQCVDGVCCDTPCTGQCEYCALPGSQGACSIVTGGEQPMGGRPVCTFGEDDVCGGSCQGLAQACSYPGRDVDCGSTCSGAVETRLTCGGNGQCSVDGVRNCAPFGCSDDGIGCERECKSSLDCSTGAQCNKETGECTFVDALCVDAFTLERSDGQRESCTPYICSARACLRECQTSAECAAEYLCTLGECVPLDRSAPSDGSASDGSSTDGSASDGSSTDGGMAGGPTDGDEETAGGGCHYAPGPNSAPSRSWSMLAAFGIVALLSRRRRHLA